jgi:hypothetical protein
MVGDTKLSGLDLNSVHSIRISYFFFNNKQKNLFILLHVVFLLQHERMFMLINNCVKRQILIWFNMYTFILD